jgi:hypothetical protein
VHVRRLKVPYALGISLTLRQSKRNASTEMSSRVAGGCRIPDNQLPPTSFAGCTLGVTRVPRDGYETAQERGWLGFRVSMAGARRKMLQREPPGRDCTRGQGGPDGADLERRDTRAHQNEPGGVPCGGADEYARSDRLTRPVNSRLTSVAANPGDAGP